MSENSTIIEPAATRRTSRPYPPMAPQWALELFRPLVWIVSRLFWRIRWVGLENIPSSGGLIIAPNHQTYVDPFWVSYPVRRPVRYLAWDAAFNWPIAGTALRLFGAWPLQLEGSDPAPIRRSMQFVRDGGAVMIFPEGGRGNPDGTMKRFKAGAVRLALETGATVLPVTVRGAHRIWPSTRSLPRPGRVEIVYHAPISINPQSDEESRACARRQTEVLAEIIRSAL